VSKEHARHGGWTRASAASASVAAAAAGGLLQLRGRAAPQIGGGVEKNRCTRQQPSRGAASFSRAPLFFRVTNCTAVSDVDLIITVTDDLSEGHIAPPPPHLQSSGLVLHVY